MVLDDEGCLRVYPSLDAVTLQIEGLDAEHCSKEVWCDRGQSYVIEWLTPTERGWFWFCGVSSGTYRLVPAGPPNPKALFALNRRIENEGRCPLPDEVRRLCTSLEAS